MGVKHIKGLIANKITLEQYIPIWLAARKPYLEPGTWVNYETDSRKRLIPAFGNRRLGTIETHHIRDWLVEAAEMGDYAPKTLNNTLGTLSNEIKPYLEGCLDLYAPLAQLLIGTGMRISEAIALRWKDVDWDNRVIRVYRQRKRDGDGKTKSRQFRPVVVRCGTPRRPPGC